MEKVKYALWLAAQGFYVHPLKPNSKLPLLKGWPGKATRSTKTIREWWRETPDANIGIATEKFGDGQALVCIDIDVKKSAKGTVKTDGYDAMFKLHEELSTKEGDYAPPDTLTVVTPSGGAHLYFTNDVPLAQGTNVLGKGVDIRSRGGYVVAPGSTIDGEMYKPKGETTSLAKCPAPYLDRIRAHKEGTKSTSTKKNTADVKLDSTANTSQAITYLRGQGVCEEGARNDTAYRHLTMLRDFGVSQDAALDLLNEHWQCEPPLPSTELAVLLESAYTNAENEPGCKAHESKFGNSIKLIRYSELLQRKASTYVVNKLLPERGVATLFGPSGAYKSFVLIDLGLHIATGKDWFGRKVKKRPVVYIAGEGGYGVAVRMRTWHVAKGVAADDFVVADGAIDLSNQLNVGDMLDAIEAAGFDEGSQPVVIVDTVARCLHGDENSASDVGAFINNCYELAQSLDSLVVLVHHTGKDVNKGERGSSSFRNNVDAAFLVTKARDLGTRLSCQKMKDGPIPERLDVVFELADTGITDEYGEAVSAPRIVEVGEDLLEDESSDEAKEAAQKISQCKLVLELILLGAQYESAVVDAAKARGLDESAGLTKYVIEDRIKHMEKEGRLTKGDTVGPRGRKLLEITDSGKAFLNEPVAKNGEAESCDYAE